MSPQIEISYCLGCKVRISCPNGNIYKVEIWDNKNNKLLLSGLSYDDVRERYEHFRARCTKKPIIKVEKGCTESLYGEKSKCVIKIVPQSNKCKTFQMNQSCKKKRIKID